MIEKICNEIDITPEQLIIKQLQQENKQLKDNWNKLKEYLETIYKGCPPYEKEVLMFITDRIQDLEQGSDINDSNR